MHEMSINKTTALCGNDSGGYDTRWLKNKPFTVTTVSLVTMY